MIFLISHTINMSSSGENDRIYIYVDLFDKKKKYYDTCIGNTYENISKAYCINDELNNIGIQDFVETCPMIIDCLYEQRETATEKVKDEDCISLFYWTYDKYYKDKKEYDNIKKHYHGFLQAYNNYTVSICHYFKENLTEDVLKKLRDIYDMNTELNKIKTNNVSNISDKCVCAKKFAEVHKKYENMCKSNDDKHFCTELNKLTTEYNLQIKNITCENNTPSYLSLFQRYNKKAHIYVPIVVALFTIWGSFLRNIIIRKRNISNNLYKESNMLQPSQKFSSNSRNKNYNILYNSD
ncbi:variable surface protein [Plasmodium gonderi]|uniref:Variable surface protein n=1 Tax=Plasmodium gonderi TaxID=77519 RepID=A0A1Y1JUV8_PLAGO|nr:variable surface protein [Plasmodium gonderi]GAW84532.1 variable surface protein [Plasmodium gonderi]